MATQFTSILKLALPTQGELSGSWGTVVNENITTMIEQAIAGLATINTWSSNSHTLTIASGLTSESRCAMLSLTDTNTQLSAAGTVVCPALSKTYIVKNGAGQIVTVKTASGSGIAIPSGKTMLLFCDGTNVVEAVDHVVTMSAGTLTITGLTTFASIKGVDSTTVTGILDEDNMASNSATKLVTQQSVKAYVDSQVGTVDTLAEILANGNTTGGANIVASTDDKVQFRDSAIYINSSADGQLDIVADTEIQIAATTVDINGAINASGEIIAASLDISGNIDVDGTTNLDVVDIDGATQIDATVSVGVDDTGYDVKFFGATSGKSLLWDESADSLIVTGTTTMTGNSTVSGTLGVTGVLTGTSLDISGDIDVDGTTNLDIVDIDGAVDMASTLAVDTRVGIGVAAHASAALNITTTDQHIRFNNGSELGIIDLDSDGELNIWAHGDGEVINLKTGSGTGNNILSIAGSASTFSGTVTANAGVVVDTMTIDGSTIASTGSLGLDIGGNLTIDVDGTTITLADGGANWGQMFNSAQNFFFKNPTADKDIIFQGIDGSSPITALTLDMSAAGVATFNSNIIAGGTIQADGNISTASDSGALRTGAGHDLKITYDGTNGEIDVNSGDLTLDVAGSIVLDAVGHISTPTAGTSNVKLGVNAGNSIASGGNYNTVVGDEAGTAITTGDYNTALGFDAGKAVDTGFQNTFIGSLAGSAMNTGNLNTAVGIAALTADTKGQNSTAIGRRALATQNFTSATDSYNTAVGALAGEAVTTGINNTLIGGLAGDALQDADHNVAVGAYALTTDTLGSNSVAIGRQALQTQNFTSATSAFNTAVGDQAGLSVTTGVQNTLVGANAGDALTDADSNVAVGYGSLSSDTKGSRTVAIGRNALITQNFTSATSSNSTAVGYEAGRNTTTGINNCFFGSNAGYAITDADDNVAIGRSALATDVLGSKSVAVGNFALQNQKNVDGSGNPVAADMHNVAVGYHAGNDITTGTGNCFVGSLAGDTVTTGIDNVIVGQNSDGVSYLTKGNGLGKDLTVSGGYTTLGFGSDDIRAAHGNVTWATVSDQRYKKDIVDSTAGLSFINALQPRTFKYKNLGELPETFSAYEADSTEVFKNSNTNHGFIAQEVKAAIDADSSIKDGFRLWDDREDGSQEVAEAALIPVLTKAIQELSAQVEALTARIETLEG